MCDRAGDLEQPEGQYYGAGAKHGRCEANNDDEAVKHQQIVRVLLSWNTHYMTIKKLHQENAFAYTVAFWKVSICFTFTFFHPHSFVI